MRVLLLVGDAHSEQDEPDPTPDRGVNALDNRFVIRSQPEGVRWLELEKILSHVASFYPISAGEPFHQGLGQVPARVDLRGRDETGALQVGNASWVSNEVKFP